MKKPEKPNRNIEIKAHIRDWHQTRQIIETICDSGPELIKQKDLFFFLPRGRLKLRFFSDIEAELIYYERTDQCKMKTSFYRRKRMSDPQRAKRILSDRLGLRNIVTKKRLLYLVGQTRIHLDQVEKLGQFIELEYVLEPKQNEEQGTLETRRLMKKLGIKTNDLVACAYVDLLETQQKSE